MQGGVRLNNKVMVTQSLRRVVDQKFRKLKNRLIRPLDTSLSYPMCKFRWSRINLRSDTRVERGRGRAGPRGGKNFRRPYLVCKFFSRVETLSIVFPMVELPYGHIFIVIREKNYTSPYRASILSRNVSYSLYDIGQQMDKRSSRKF